MVSAIDGGILKFAEAVQPGVKIKFPEFGISVSVSSRYKIVGKILQKSVRGATQWVVYVTGGTGNRFRPLRETWYLCLLGIPDLKKKKETKSLE